MSASSSNPFVLPGMGQSGQAASNPLLASMEMMRQAFAGLSGPAGMGAGSPMGSAMNPEDLERRIAELKTVENWLKLNLSMLGSTIQGMEVQLATIATLRSFMSSASSMAEGFSGGSPSPLEVVLGLRPQAGGSTGTTAYVPTPAATPTPPAAEPAPAAPAPTSEAASTAEPTSASTIPEAAQAWWDMLKQQFGNVAAATAATMTAAAAGDKPAVAPKKAAAKKASAKKTAVRKAPAKKTSVRKTAGKKAAGPDTTTP